MITAPQINIMTSVSNSPFSVPQGGSEVASSGGFMNILAAMMADGGNKGGGMLSMFQSQNMSVKDMLQGFINGNELDPLLLSLIQQLLAAPQQMQDVVNGFVTAGDNMVQQLAQFNYGQLKDLAEFVNAFANNNQAAKPMTLEEIRAAIMDKFARSMEVSADTSEVASQPLKEAEMVTIDEPIELKGIKDGGLQIKHPLVQQHSPEVQQTMQDIKVLTATDGEKDIRLLMAHRNTGQHLTLLNDKGVSPTLSELIDDLGLTDGLNITEVEIESAPTTASNGGKDSVILDTQRLESAAVTGSGQTYQTATPKNEQTLKEALHVNRLQEIDTKIIKAVESGQNSLTVRLEPPELGSVKIKLVLADGMVRADIRVDNAAVKDMMNLAMPQIKNSLENAGIKVSEFFVDIREEYYSDGRRQNQEQDGNKQQKQKRQEGEDFKPFDFFI